MKHNKKNKKRLYTAGEHTVCWSFSSRTTAISLTPAEQMLLFTECSYCSSQVLWKPLSWLHWQYTASPDWKVNPEIDTSSYSSSVVISFISPTAPLDGILSAKFWASKTLLSAILEDVGRHRNIRIRVSWSTCFPLMLIVWNGKPQVYVSFSVPQWAIDSVLILVTQCWPAAESLDWVSPRVNLIAPAMRHQIAASLDWAPLPPLLSACLLMKLCLLSNLFVRLLDPSQSDRPQCKHHFL